MPELKLPEFSGKSKVDCNFLQDLLGWYCDKFNAEIVQTRVFEEGALNKADTLKALESFRESVRACIMGKLAIYPNQLVPDRAAMEALFKEFDNLVWKFKARFTGALKKAALDTEFKIYHEFRARLKAHGAAPAGASATGGTRGCDAEGRAVPAGPKYNFSELKSIKLPDGDINSDETTISLKLGEKRKYVRGKIISLSTVIAQILQGDISSKEVKEKLYTELCRHQKTLEKMKLLGRRTPYEHIYDLVDDIFRTDDSGHLDDPEFSWLFDSLRKEKADRKREDEISKRQNAVIAREKAIWERQDRHSMFADLMGIYKNYYYRDGARAKKGENHKYHTIIMLGLSRSPDFLAREMAKHMSEIQEDLVRLGLGGFEFGNGHLFNNWEELLRYLLYLEPLPPIM
jgi:hypothetical protein